MKNHAVKLQVAFDTLAPGEILSFLEAAHSFVDIAELGTPYLLLHGAGILSSIRSRFLDVAVLCDTKIVDAGYYEAAEMFKLGANYVTALALADIATLSDCVRAANAHGGQVAADMICVEDLQKKTQALEQLGVHMLAVHTGVDQQAAGRTPLADLAQIREVATQAQIAVAGGISLASIAQYKALQPDVVVVGSAIFNAKNPVAEVAALYRALQP